MDSGLFFQSVKIKEIYGNTGLSGSKELQILILVRLANLRPPF